MPAKQVQPEAWYTPERLESFRATSWFEILVL